MTKRGEESGQKQQQTLNEFIVIFLLVFLLTNAVPNEQGQELFRPWFLMFCIVRLSFTFLLVLPERQLEERNTTN